MDMSLASKIEFMTVNNALIRLDEIAAIVNDDMNRNKSIIVLRSGFKIQFYDMSDKTKDQLNNLMKIIGVSQVPSSNNDLSNTFNKIISGSLDSDENVPDDLPF